MNRLLKVALFFLIVGLMALPAQAQNWIGLPPAAADSWNVPGNWSTTLVPVAGDTTYIDDTEIGGVAGPTYSAPQIDTINAVTGSLLIGNTLPGELNINGGSLTVDLFRVGGGAGTSVVNMTGGTVTKNATGSSTRFGWNAGGGPGTGNLNMSNAAQWNVADNFIVGYDGGTGNVQMANTAQILQSSAAFFVGLGGGNGPGIGYLSMSDSAYISTPAFTVAQWNTAGGAGTSGTVTMLGTSRIDISGEMILANAGALISGVPTPSIAHVTLGNATAGNQGDAPQIYINGTGQSNVGIWQYSQGYLDLYDNAYIQKSTGAFVVGDDWNDPDGLGLALSEGFVTINDNALMNVQQIWLGSLAYGRGTMTIKDAGTLTPHGDVVLGRAGGTGTLTVTDGGGVRGNGAGNRYVSILGHDGGTATLTMTGTVGGTPTYESAEMLIGQNVGSTGTVNVTNGTVTLASSPDWSTEWWYGWEGTLDIGRWGGTGHVTFDGGTISVGGRTNIGNGDDYAGHTSHGDLTLKGNAQMTTSQGSMRNYGWVWNDGGDVYVGCAEWDNGVNARTQTQGGGVGTLTVQDNASLSIPTGTMCVGVHAGTGTTTITGNGSVSVTNWLQVGVWNGGDGTVILGDGTGTDYPTLTAGAVNFGAAAGHGELHMTSGNATFGDFFTGNNPGATGLVNVSGGYLTSNGWISVGCDSGVGTMNVSGTATVDVPNGYLYVGRGGTGVYNQTGGTVTALAAFLSENSSAELNLDGGTLSVNYVQAGWGFGTGINSTFSFNGGTLIARSNDSNFFRLNGSPSFNAYIKTDGGTIDTSTYYVTINQPLQAHPTLTGGGLTKVGAGRLTLNAANTYTGLTLVSEGTLQVPAGASLASTGVTVAGSAVLDLGAHDGIAPETLTLNDTSTLGLTLTGSVADPNAVDVTAGAGAVSLAGGVSGAKANVVLSPTGRTPFDTSGPYTIVNADAITGTAANLNVTVNTRNTVASTVVNPTNIQVTLGAGAAENLTWNPAGGSLSTNWELKDSQASWTYAGAPPQTNFYELDTVNFTDLATSSYTYVNLVGTLHPSDIVVDSTLEYTFSGTGVIVGDGTTLTKNNTGKLNIDNGDAFGTGLGNSFTGGVTVNGGELHIGSNAVTPLGFNNTITTNNAGSITADAGIDLGVGGTSRTLVMNDTSSMTVGHLYNAGRGLGSVAVVELNDSASITTTGTGDNGALNFGSDRGHAEVTMTGDSSMTGNAWLSFARDTGSTATVEMDGDSYATCVSWFNAGAWGNAQADITMSGNAQMDLCTNGNDWASFGVDGRATVTLNEYAEITAGNCINIGDGGANGYGVMTLNDDAVVTAHGIWIGNSAGSYGELNVYGNSRVHSPDVELEVPWSGTGVLNVGDGNPAHDAQVDCQQILLGYSSNTTSGTINLNAGGTIITTRIFTDSAPLKSVVNFDGGVLRADTVGTTVPVARFINNDGGALDFQLNVKTGGAIIDSNGYDITIPEPLLNGVSGTDGGLTKNGLGTLTLMPRNASTPTASTYNGPTVVNQGSLIVAPMTSIATSSLTVAGGATFGVYKGTSVTSEMSAMNLAASSTLAMSVPETASTADAIYVTKDGTGVLTLPTSGTANLVLTPLGLIDPAGYTVVKYDVLDPLGGTVASNVAATVNPLYHAHVASVTEDPDPGIHVNIVDDSVDLVWTGTGDNTTWEAGNSVLNWQDSVPSAQAYLNLDNVTFSTVGSVYPNVTLVGGLVPGSITVDGTVNYTFSGAGSIVGEGTTLDVSNGAYLTISNTGANLFTGDVTVSGGSTVAINSNTALGVNNTVSLSGVSTLAPPVDWTLANGDSQNLSVAGGSGVNVTGNLVFASNLNSTAGISIASSTVTVGGRLYAGFANGSTANITMTGGTLSVGGTTPEWTQIAYVNGSAANIALSGGAQFANNEPVGIAYGTATATITADASTLSAIGDLRLGAGGTLDATFSNGSNVLCNNGASAGNLHIGLWGGDASVQLNSGSYMYAQNELYVSYAGAGTGVLEVNNSTVQVDGWAQVGRESGNGTLTLTGTSTFTANNEFRLGWIGGTGTLNLQDTSRLSSNHLGNIGRDGGSIAYVNITGGADLVTNYWEASFGSNGGHAEVYMDGTNPSDSALISAGVYSDGYWLSFGRDAGSSATLEMHGNSEATSNAFIEMGTYGASCVAQMYDDARIYDTGAYGADFNAGSYGAASHAELYMHDNASISTVGKMEHGQEGTFVLEMYGASLLHANSWMRLGGNGGNATATVNGGTVEASDIQIARGGTGTVTVGGSADPALLRSSNGIELGWENDDTADARATLTIKTGGTVETQYVRSAKDASTGPVSSVLNFDGGTLKATASSTTFVSNTAGSAEFKLNVKDGGAKINTQANDVSITEPLLHDAGASAKDGGLYKAGTGSLTLTADPEYTGDTTVNKGSLTVGVLDTPLGDVDVRNDLTASLTATSITAKSLSIGLNASDPELSPVAAAAPADPEGKDGLMNDPNRTLATTTFKDGVRIEQSPLEVAIDPVYGKFAAVTSTIPGSGMVTPVAAPGAKGSPAAVPEPSTWILLILAGLGGLAAARRRK